MNLVLCGMMGSGKSTVGKLLAKITSWEWVDTDELIVSRYGKITDIFEQKGEGYFRALETKIVQELAKKDRLVISTGGGLVLKEENVSLLKKNGKFVYLRAKKETLALRLAVDKDRPLLQTSETLDEKLARLLQERGEIYEGVADSIIDVDEKAPADIVKEILAGEK
jgi:shikimate kinase